MTRILAGVLVILALIHTPPNALALITGGTGNEPLNVGMLNGAGKIINRPDRIAWWERDGSPFFVDGIGDAKAINEILTDFARLNVKTKRVVVHDGIGQSFFLNMNLRAEMKKAANIDWTFAFWPNGRWENSRWLTGRPNQSPEEKPDLPAQIDVYTANIRWADVVVPSGIDVIDLRLEPHGFTAADGIVLEGAIKEHPGGQPIVGTVRVWGIASIQGKNDKERILGETKSNADGKWVLKNLPAAWVKIVVVADGFAPRVVGEARCFDQPQWHSFDAELVRAVTTSGRVTDQSGTPVADVEVRLVDVTAIPGGNYELPSSCKTGKDGRFRLDQAPTGTANFWLSKQGYSAAGRDRAVTLPANDIELQLTKSGSIP